VFPVCRGAGGEGSGSQAEDPPAKQPLTERTGGYSVTGGDCGLEKIGGVLGLCSFSHTGGSEKGCEIIRGKEACPRPGKSKTKVRVTEDT